MTCDPPCFKRQWCTARYSLCALCFFSAETICLWRLSYRSLKDFRQNVFAIRVWIDNVGSSTVRASKAEALAYRILRCARATTCDWYHPSRTFSVRYLRAEYGFAIRTIILADQSVVDSVLSYRSLLASRIIRKRSGFGAGPILPCSWYSCASLTPVNEYPYLFR